MQGIGLTLECNKKSRLHAFENFNFENFFLSYETRNVVKKTEKRKISRHDIRITVVKLRDTKNTNVLKSSLKFPIAN